MKNNMRSSVTGNLFSKLTEFLPFDYYRVDINKKSKLGSMQYSPLQKS